MTNPDNDLVTVRAAQPSEPGEAIPPPERCASCKLPDHMCQVPGTIETHAVLGRACFACRDTEDTIGKLVAMLEAAPSRQLNQTSMARKLGRTASSMNRALGVAVRRKLIENAYTNPNLERPSATTYRLKAATTGAAK